MWISKWSQTLCGLDKWESLCPAHPITFAYLATFFKWWWPHVSKQRLSLTQDKASVAQNRKQKPKADVEKWRAGLLSPCQSGRTNHSWAPIHLLQREVIHRLYRLVTKGSNWKTKLNYKSTCKYSVLIQKLEYVRNCLSTLNNLYYVHA